MCALQMQAEAGPTLLDQPDGLEPYLEKFIVKQVGAVFLSQMVCQAEEKRKEKDRTTPFGVILTAWYTRHNGSGCVHNSAAAQ